MEGAFSLHRADSDSESIRSDISETFGTIFQRRPGSGRRKARPVRSPFDGYASASSDSQGACNPKDYVPSRLGISSHIVDGCSPSLPATSCQSPASQGAPSLAAPAVTSNPTNSASSNRKKTRQDLTGPCCHCGAIQSPQWRKGPKGKPILCNACGIRFLRTRSLGKSMPKKRRAPAQAAAPAAVPVATTAATNLPGSASPMSAAAASDLDLDIRSIHPKRTKVDNPNSEDDDVEMDLGTDEVLGADDVLEDTHSGPLTNSHSSSAFATPTLQGTSSIVSMMTHLTSCLSNPQLEQPLPGFAARSRLSIATNAAAGAAAGNAAATAATPETLKYGHVADGADGSEGGQHDPASPALLLAAAAAAAAAAGDSNNSFNNLIIRNTAASANAAGSTAFSTAGSSGNVPCASSSGSFGHVLLGPGSSSTQQPLAAGSRHILLGTGGRLGGLISGSPSLALALALHQQHQQHRQQQPNSPAKVGVSMLAATNSPLSNASTLSALKFEHSGDHSAICSSPPASPLLLAGASSYNHQRLQQAASSTLRGSPAMGCGSGGGNTSSVKRVQSQQHQQQQLMGLHGPSPLSLVSSGGADSAAVAALAGADETSAALCDEHAAASAATAAATCSSSGRDVLQLVSHMVGVLGGVHGGSTALHFLKAINGGTAAGAHATAASADAAVAQTADNNHEQQ